MAKVRISFATALGLFACFFLVIFLQTGSIEKSLSFESTSCWLRGPLSADDPRILEVLRRQYLVSPSTQPYNLTEPKPSSEDEYYYPESSFEIIGFYVRQFLGDQRKGFFVEAGAFDGEVFSNSLWLEKELGWDGLLVEADPDNFRHLAWRRRKAWISNTCISRYSYPQEVTFEGLQGLTNDLPRVYHSNSRVLSSPFRKLDNKWNRNSVKSYFKVQCFALVSYLLALNVTTLDLLILDIQGHEWEVIKTLLLDKVTVRVMVVEYYSISPDGEIKEGEFNADFANYMEGIGYQVIDFEKENNYILVLKTDPILRKKIDPTRLVKYKYKKYANR